jgi:hypothetical protein
MAAGWSAFKKPYEAMVFVDGANIIAVNRDGGYIDHGAAGVDDDIVIQSALTYVGAITGTVALGAGVYVIYATLSIPSYVNLVGQGPSTLLYLENGVDDNVILMSGVTSNTISDMYIDGNAAGNAAGSGIRINHGAPSITLISIHDVFVYGAAEYGVYISPLSGFTTLRDSIIIGCGYGPVYDGTATTSIVSNVHGYAPLNNQRNTISNLLEILGDVRGLYPGIMSSGVVLPDYSMNSHNGVSGEDLVNLIDFQGKTYAYYMNSATPTRTLTVPDDPDFSFGTGLADSAFSLVCAFYRTTLGACTLISKRDDTLAQMEWWVDIGAGAASPITFYCYDQSVPAYINVVSSDILWDTNWHTMIATYDGSSVETGLTIYYDGVDVSLANNINGVYVAMENLAADVGLGCHHDNGVVSGVFTGEMTWFGITGKELDADEAWSVDQRLRGVLSI